MSHIFRIKNARKNKLLCPICRILIASFCSVKLILYKRLKHTFKHTLRFFFLFLQTCLRLDGLTICVLLYKTVKPRSLESTGESDCACLRFNVALNTFSSRTTKESFKCPHCAIANEIEF